jgi:hypothetical protein
MYLYHYAIMSWDDIPPNTSRFLLSDVPRRMRMSEIPRAYAGGGP